MRFSIMFLDMLKLRRLSKSGNVPIQLPQPLVDSRISRTDVANVAFEMLDVDGVEADDCRVESYIGFGDVRAEIIGRGVFGEVGFDAVEGGEEGLDGFFVGFLGSVW